jgi:hypothetical protein
MLDSELYRRILQDFASIDYAGVLRFARYSDPMAKEAIFALISQALRALPRARIGIQTS